ncbi:MAG TPA: AMIN domain-containing protein, partial [bacterium]|nr:AMIN domain-containing protein [bacterium]
MIFFLLFTLLQVESFNSEKDFYILISSDDQNVTFSSFRLTNPDRIVLEVSGSCSANELNPSLTVKEISILEKDGITRFVFNVAQGSHY